MIEEIGEAVAVIKKKGDAAIVSEPRVRSVFLEEMADVADVLYGDSPAIRRDPGRNC